MDRWMDGWVRRAGGIDRINKMRIRAEADASRNSRFVPFSVSTFCLKLMMKQDSLISMFLSHCKTKNEIIYDFCLFLCVLFTTKRHWIDDDVTDEIIRNSLHFLNPLPSPLKVNQLLPLFYYCIIFTRAVMSFLTYLLASNIHNYKFYYSI